MGDSKLDDLVAQAEALLAERDAKLRRLVGYYELTQEVENPEADRRRTRDVTSRPRWTRGTRFRVVEGERSNSVELEFTRVRFNRLQRIGAHDPRFRLLLDNAKRVEENFGEFYDRHRLKEWSEEVLGKLVEKGVVSREDLVELRQACEDEG